MPLISAENMRRGATLARWYLEEALRFFVDIERIPEEENALILETWLIEQYKTGIHKESRRKANRELLSRKKERFDVAITNLAERNRRRILKEGKSIFLEIKPEILSDIE